jgi:hypothetical protein
MTQYVDPKNLSPEARAFYEECVERMGKEKSKIWLQTGYYVMDDDLNAVPASFCEWAVQYGGDHRHERQIRIDKHEGWYVSTVFLGLDHGFNYREDPDYKPVLWETMIFWEGEDDACPHPELKNEMDRYSSVQDAIHGHAAMFDKLKDALRDHNRK